MTEKVKSLTKVPYCHYYTNNGKVAKQEHRVTTDCHVI